LQNRKTAARDRSLGLIMNYEDMVFVQSTTIIPVPTNQDKSSIYILVALFEQASQIYYRHDMHGFPFKNSKLMGFMKISVLITI
jgi:hypothetical protein